jgi:hypothetical protein
VFGSQALETGIGLAVMFFLLATAASAIAEIYAAAVNKRSKDLKNALKSMLSTGELPEGAAAVTPEDVERLLKTATGKTNTAYLSAKSFADAACELVAKAQNIGNLQTKMETIAREARGQLTSVKAGLETWFDETMAAAKQQYSKYATVFLFITGAVLAVALNASTIDVARDLWTDSAARQAVVEAAGSAEETTKACVAEGTAVEQAQCAVANISAFQLPIGWGSEQRDDMNGAWWLSHLAGWLLTALLVMLGAPFWFDLLNRLVSLRANGSPPPTAAKDPGSSVTLARETGTDVSPVVLTPTSGGAPQAALPAIQRGTPTTALQPVTLADTGATNWLEIALNKNLPPMPQPAQPSHPDKPPEGR